MKEITITMIKNCVYKSKHPHEFKDKDCTTFDKIKIYQPMGK